MCIRQDFIKNKKSQQSTVLFRNFSYLCHQDGEATPSRQKKKRISLFCARLFVSLQKNLRSHAAPQQLEQVLLHSLCSDFGIA